MRKKYLSALLFGALLVTSAGTFTSCKDYDDDIKNLQEQIDERATLEELQKQISTMQADVDAAKADAEAAKQKAEEALKAATENAGGLTQEEVEALIETAQANLQAQIDKLAKLTDVEAKIAALKEELSKEFASSEALAALSEEVDSLSASINELIGGRLTSLVFAPTTYIDGVEAIKFATLKYKPWTNLLADAADGTTDITINDGTAVAEYHVSPSSVSLSKIESLEFISNNAENISRATQAPISVASKKIENGKLILGLKKEATASFGGDDTDEFTIVALKAKTILTEEEEQNEVNPYVFSDWARLYETSVTPYIHYAEYEAESDGFNGEVPEHFYPYTTVCDGGNEGVSSTDGAYIIKNIAYNVDGFDLLPLVEVCDKNNGRYDAESYDMAFEFNLVNYYLQDGTAPEEKTNQKEFARIEGTKIYSQSRDGQSNNKDAIGREPLVQVVLKDTKNGKVVDVRYFKIKWTTADSQIDLGQIANPFTGNYNKDMCEAAYVNKVLTADMNDNIYAKLNVSKEDFHRLYKLNTTAYASFDDAKNDVVSTKLGTFKDIVASGSTTTHNIEWTLNIADYAVTQSEYEAGKAVREVFGVYENVNDPNDVYIFKLTLELKVAQMALNRGYMQAYWNKETVTTADETKSFQVNPALTSDVKYGTSANYTDCQIVGDIKDGYFQKPVNVLDLVDNAATAKFIFDSDRVAEVLGSEWTVSTDGQTLSKGLEIAATIDAAGIVQLYEGANPGVSGQPTDAARELAGKSVPVKLYSDYCASTTILKETNDKFLVNFINPLEMELKQPEGSFQDLVTGGSKVNIAGLATIKETFGLKRVVLGTGAVAGLDDWYMVEDITWDIDNATTNLAVNNGNLVISNDVTATKWSVIEGYYPKMELSISADKQTLEFNNASGTHLQQTFKIAIPVYVKTKWNPTLSDSSKKIVVIDVTPGITE